MRSKCKMLQQDTEGAIHPTHTSQAPLDSSTDEESDLEEFREISPRLSRGSGHSLVIARPTQIGTVSAAQCSATVNQRFPNVRFALMVGIGAGIPNPPSRDIRLGDITVSIAPDNHPGVIQYDFGQYEGDGFVLKVPLIKTPVDFDQRGRIIGRGRDDESKPTPEDSKEHHKEAWI
ncbi:hypothetical protein AARAC_006167 [Aspergillus arachidicola]|uniref:Nucleoside phosphorylase domain-containing protein n=1 Tax=Aspergillus arachidicola TaxID=656916 RepID=A0A2G7EP77_9EURO|nr:hypothetical protein AARAC_006167 [Aspergillus arachidicola]